MAIPDEIVGKTIGKWHVLEALPQRPRVRARCLGCDRVYSRSAYSIAAGGSAQCKSCGSAQAQTSHGMAGTKIYSAWAVMRKNHGGAIVEAWDDFDEFYRDMAPRPEGAVMLIRPDESKRWGPGNAVWKSRAAAPEIFLSRGDSAWRPKPLQHLGKNQKRILKILGQSRAPVRASVLAGLLGVSQSTCWNSLVGMRRRGLVLNRGRGVGWDLDAVGVRKARRMAA